MQEVAVGNYRAFTALLAIREEVSSIDKHLESLIDEIPKLTSGWTEFLESVEQILEKRKMNQTLLANHNTLFDLLEIPQLMDTFVLTLRSGLKILLSGELMTTMYMILWRLGLKILNPWKHLHMIRK